jgi:hypothetical protein
MQVLNLSRSAATLANNDARVPARSAGPNASYIIIHQKLCRNMQNLNIYIFFNICKKFRGFHCGILKKHPKKNFGAGLPPINHSLVYVWQEQ